VITLITGIELVIDTPYSVKDPTGFHKLNWSSGVGVGGEVIYVIILPSFAAIPVF
jgi:hypothetical protein